MNEINITTCHGSDFVIKQNLILIKGLTKEQNLNFSQIKSVVFVRRNVNWITTLFWIALSVLTDSGIESLSGQRRLIVLKMDDKRTIDLDVDDLSVYKSRRIYKHLKRKVSNC